jgi:hypothetical protein
VEGEDPDRARPRADHLPDALAHLAAALLVKVMARISFGCTPCAASRWATRWVRTRVFPEPAPAITSTGPSTVNTASR